MQVNFKFLTVKESGTATIIYKVDADVVMSHSESVQT